MSVRLLGGAAAAACLLASTPVLADDPHLLMIYNHESGDLLIRGNVADDALAEIPAKTQAIRATGWDSADIDFTPGFGAVACARKPGLVWFTWSTGHPDAETARSLADAAAQKYAREEGATFVPECGPGFRNDNATPIVLDLKAPAAP